MFECMYTMQGYYLWFNISKQTNKRTYILYVAENDANFIQFAKQHSLPFLCATKLCIKKEESKTHTFSKI